MDDSSPQRKHGGKINMPIACRHIADNLDVMSARRIGYHIDPSDRKPLPDAWCGACDKVLFRAGGQWTPEILALVAFREVCPCCYDLAVPKAIVRAASA